MTLITSVKKHRVGKQIKAREVRLIGEDGNQVGVITINEALQAAEGASLDLVEINPNSKPPICKIMDYGKFRYEQSKKERESKQKRKIIEVKEVKFRPKIDVHDYETKKRMVLKFIEQGNKVKITLTFRGREIVYKKQGLDMLEQLSKEVAEYCLIERDAKMEGKNVTLILAPKPSN